MNPLKRIRDRLFGVPKGESPVMAGGNQHRPMVADSAALRLVGTPCKKGDFIGKHYEVLDLLGEGGFGVVYKVYSHEAKQVFAAKTFLDEFLNDQKTREMFSKEAKLWVDMGRHPYLVRAHYVEEISHRLYIIMEYIAPIDAGPNSLEGYLRSQPPDLIQSLRWAIQFCHGMEYVYSRGVRCHRDIKPSNILIGSDNKVKISDFGLAGVLGAFTAEPDTRLSIQNGRIGLSCQTMEGTGFGTPTHMAPEQFTNASECDERSDIYSFGVVLYQMQVGGRPPFLAPLPRDNSEEEATRFWRAMHRLHTESLVPPINSHLFPAIKRCLQKSPRNRYRSFQELRSELEPLLHRLTGDVISTPDLKDLEAWEWGNKGLNLKVLGRFEEALDCYDRAIEINPRSEAAVNGWSNKAVTFRALNRLHEALGCCDSALALDPTHVAAWMNKGIVLEDLGRHEESIACYDRTLRLAPNHSKAWHNKGNTLSNMRRFADALRCYDQALVLGAREAPIWNSKGATLKDLGRFEEARSCYDRALELDSRDAMTWRNKGRLLLDMLRFEDALSCFEQAVEYEPNHFGAWANKAYSLAQLRRFEEAIGSLDKAIQIDPGHPTAWFSKGAAFDHLGRFDEAVSHYEKTLALSPTFGDAWWNKALAEEKLGRIADAVHSYEQLVSIGSPSNQSQVDHAQKRLRELTGA